MIDMEQQMRAELDRIVETPAPPDWSEVLTLAGHRDVRSSPRWAGRRWAGRRFATAIGAFAAMAGVVVAVAVGTPVGTAIVQGLGDFSSWLTGEPGQPSTPAEQEAFERETRSWAGFPQGVGLRRLIDTRVDGTRFRLDGYRVNGELCLRLVATGAASVSTTSCAPASDLRAREQPALVVFVDYPVGGLAGLVRIGPVVEQRRRAMVTAGIVADGVRSVEIVGEDGRRAEALVSGDSFLAIVDRPSVTYQTRQVRATTDGGEVISIPFASAAGFTVARSALHSPPAAAPREPRGPTRVERQVRGGSVPWLIHRQARGVPVPENLRGAVRKALSYRMLGHPVTFERLITPDPNGPFKLVVAYGPWGPWACTYVVGPPAAGTSSGGCHFADELFREQPIALSGFSFSTADQYVIHSGFASDAVARIAVFLATGERIAVPLRDNVFVVQVPRTGSPARLVGYDAEGRVIAVQPWPSLSFQPRPGQTPAANAKWRTSITVSSRGTQARLMTVPASNGGTCYSIIFGRNGRGSVRCPAREWDGPPLQIGHNSPGGGGAFVAGRVRPDITEIAVHFANGDVLTIKPYKGLVLVAVPAKTARAHRGQAYAVGFNRDGKQVARTDL